ncbi:YifB family Mg chelatase-like AAA ATPase [Candidatus Cyrtobacter comes]|uniref:YifB family Mg chelatase-like AAA ATPase n=1 Tax=Candidatus Cyrtobacter comes TaxID=675776 RepID=UPI002ACE2780|nr:YifB family Mg chelatase-like AAA ATPase [Candidatus Cyrtobacter comes]
MTVSFCGIEPQIIEVQAQISSGLVAFNIVGLANKAIAESKERIRAAFSTIGLAFPNKRITINLAPADITKEGSHFDLAIAVALLTEMEIVPQEEVDSMMVMGELSLDASVIKVNGILPAAIKASEEKLGLICPKENGPEASWSGNDLILLAAKLIDVISHFKGSKAMEKAELPQNAPERKPLPDLADVIGQEESKRALEVAAAGRHHMLMIGPPGSGKSTLAKRLIGISPQLSSKEKLELSIISSLAGEMREGFLVNERPFRTPHSSASLASMMGGGRNAKPGEITMAHLGILFMDELPEFPRFIIDAMRQPIEDKVITISRVHNHITYPADFQLIAAMNPCKCGYYGFSDNTCNKMPRCATDYQGKISGPIYDRFDIQIFIQDTASLISKSDFAQSSEPSAIVLQRVEEASEIQAKRYQDVGISKNSQLDGENIRKFIKLDYDAEKILKEMVVKFSLSMRGMNKLLKVSKTIADLDKSQAVNKFHISEAASYKSSKVLKF